MFDAQIPLNLSNLFTTAGELKRQVRFGDVEVVRRADCGGFKHQQRGSVVVKVNPLEVSKIRL